MSSDKDEAPPFEILQLAFKSRRLAFFANRTGVPVDSGLLVVVSVDRGEDMGRVVAKLPPSEIRPELIEGAVLRLPVREDIELFESNSEFEKQVLEHCAKRVTVRNLDMRLTGCEVQMDRNRIRIFFTADQRTDFRGLVRDMASAFRARIEMRQIGVRDDAKHKDGVGICGRRLCCAGFLNDFRSVTLKAVREQGLSPNPSKVSGACSRLMCCLEYETEFYKRAAKTFPREGSAVKLAGRQANVKKADIFHDMVTVVYEDESEELIEIEEFHRRRTQPAPPQVSPEKRSNPQEHKKADKNTPVAAAKGQERKQSRGRRRHKKKKTTKDQGEN